MARKVGIAFQGGGFVAGAIGAGVVHRLVDEGAFKTFDIDAFSGTSAGALVAAVCWGNQLKGTIDLAPQILKKQWMHFAWGVVPNAEFAQMDQLIDMLARKNPVYEYCADNILVPFLHHLMKDWILAYIPVADLTLQMQKNKANSLPVPSLRLGAAEILKGEIKVFTENDFCLEAILASGSLDEVNGITEIKNGLNAGVYCDGAWGTNPPLTSLLECDVEEIWLVEVFPKRRDKIPHTPGERKDRKDELWQNSLVEHEREWIKKVNQWLNDPGFQTIKKSNGKPYKQVEVKTMPMTEDLPSGAAFVNSPSFIQKMMKYGYDNAYDAFLK